MKKNFLALIVISLLIASASAQSGSTGKNNPVGTWKFDAPYAPEGYTTGTIVVGFEEQKTTTTMSFTGSEYKLPGENVKTPNDSILFSIYLEGQDIKVMLKIETEIKMSGKAVYSEGEVPLSLNKVLAEEAEVKK
jgi:hypothetical protein